MPKRKRRGSGWSRSNSRSPRKANPNSSGEGNVELVEFAFVYREEEEDEDEVVTVKENPFTKLTCLSGEDYENENLKPAERQLQNQCLLINSSCSTPLKRSSPLSPTLFDNVRHPQSNLGVNGSAEVDPDVAPIQTPKTEEVQTSVVTSASRSKRRRIFSESSPVAVRTPAHPKRQQQQESTPKLAEEKQNKTTTSQAKLALIEKEKIDLPEAVFRVLDDYQLDEADSQPEEYRQCVKKSQKELCMEVIYELDEVDFAWLELFNKNRSELLEGDDRANLRPEEMELVLDRFEKENYYHLRNSGLGQPGESDEDAVCCICIDGESDDGNQIIFCDQCNIPVHQDCYGVPFVPEGSWLCRRCMKCPGEDLDCIFCPNKDGAFKETNDGRWAHVVCALWIPECRFANASLVEPVEEIHLIPPARWRLTCFLCRRKGIGACIQCHLKHCVTAFHVTCAQEAGLNFKIVTNDGSNSDKVRLKAYCDKHSNPEEMVVIKQKIESIKKVLAEKGSDPPEILFPSIPKERLSAVVELLSIPGKNYVVQRLLSFWKLKRKSRSGAPLLRDLDAFWIETSEEPPAPPKLEREIEMDSTPYLERARKLVNGLKLIRDYTDLVKSHSKVKQEEIDVKVKVALTQLDVFASHGLDVYLNILDKLAAKDKHSTFAEPVAEEDAPEYFDVITSPMDLSTMRKKVVQLEYSSLDELEADFNLMISNCMTYNKKSTPYFKDAVRLCQYGCEVFKQAQLVLVQRSAAADSVNSENMPHPSVLKSVDCNKKAKATSCKKYVKDCSLVGVLSSVVDELAGHDKNGVFAEPVDISETPDYLTIVKKPMDFSTIRKNVNLNHYSSIDELEADFFLMLNNCLEYNDEKSKFYKLAQKLQGVGKQILDEAKRNYCNSPLISKVVPENNNNYETDCKNDLLCESPEPEELTKDKLFSIMSDTLKRLIEKDDESIFAEPVTEEDAPGYSEMIKVPMDLSLIERKFNSSEYSSLEDLEKDFSLMIDNCKKYNTVGTKYYNYAVKMKRDGNKAFFTARKKIASFRKPNDCTKIECDQ